MKILQRQDVVCSEKTLIHYAMVRGTKDVLHFLGKGPFHIRLHRWWIWTVC